MSFQAGDDVVCINTKPIPGVSFSVDVSKHLTEGRTYRVSSVHGDETDVFLRLVGIGPPGELSGFIATRFRPVRKTDISIFTALLDTSKHKEPVG